MMVVLLRLILVVLVVRAVWRMLAGVIDGLQQKPLPPPEPVGLVRDPICGTFVVPARALTSGAGGDRRFFCSGRCRQAWVAR